MKDTTELHSNNLQQSLSSDQGPALEDFTLCPSHSKTPGVF